MIDPCSSTGLWRETARERAWGALGGAPNIVGWGYSLQCAHGRWAIKPRSTECSRFTRDRCRLRGSNDDVAIRWLRCVIPVGRVVHGLVLLPNETVDPSGVLAIVRRDLRFGHNCDHSNDDLI